jgi:hypothetical protein
MTASPHALSAAGRARRLAVAILLASTLALPARAQEADANGRTVYQAAYFQQFAPSNALELVRRVPGFSLDTGSQELRGFGQAAGNVVINGARPSSKSDSLDAILARIPAARVLRVEVGPGDLFGAEFSGRPQVLNLVLNSAGGLAVTTDATVRVNHRSVVTPEGNVSALLRRGASTFNASLGLVNRHFDEHGTDTITALPSGQLIEFRAKHNDFDDRQLSASGSWALDHGPNRQAHLNFRVSRNRFDLIQYNDVFPFAGTIRDDRLIQDYNRNEYEIGGDVSRPLFGGGLKLIGLARRRDRLDSDVVLNRVQGQVIGGFSQDLDNRRDEAVARLVWSHGDVRGWSVEAGAEGVFNRLDSEVNLAVTDANGVATRIDLPVDQAVVTEYRGEAFVNAGRALSPRLRMDLGLTYEASRLTVTGDAQAERSLRFLKPKGVLDWRQPGGWHAQLSVARTVAQLNFDDFISRAELSSSQVSGGNAELVPQRAWEILATLERPILGDGVAKIELGYNRISLLQDRVPTPQGFDAPGNIGTGIQKFVRGTLTAPLGRWVRGLRLTANGTLQDTSVEDPYTHERRSFTGYTDWQLEVGLRQDLGRWAWGIDYYGSPPVTFYRREEIDRPNGMDPFVNAFVEYRPSPRTTVTMGLDNVFDIGATRGRTFFTPDRSNPSPSSFEFRERNAHRTLLFRVRQSFG